jgi:SagB-type dehydrogenase family enzyme
MAEEADPGNGYNPLTGALFANSYRTLHLWVHATGFRTHGLRHRSLGHSNLPRIAEDFLLNSRFLRHDRETEASIQSYFFDPGTVMVSMVGEEEQGALEGIPLPEGIRLRRELGDALGRRRSRRTYTGDAIPLGHLATAIRSAGAVTAEAEAELATGDVRTFRFRTAPSGGGLYPIDIYVVSLRVNGLDRGIYRYRPLTDSLVRVGERIEAEKVVDALAIPDEIISISRANVLFLFVGHPWRSMRKYGSRGARFLFLEAGAMAQNIHLATEAIGFGSVDCASMYDDEIHEALRIDGLHQTLVHALILGYPG